MINDTLILTIPHMTNVPLIMQSQNSTAKQDLKATPRLHQHVTRNNMPGAVPLITRPSNIPLDTPKQVLPWTNVHALLGRTLQHLVTQQAINVLTICETATAVTIFTPRNLLPHAKPSHSPHFKHYTSPMVHPGTGKTISSYKMFKSSQGDIRYKA